MHRALRPMACGLMLGALVTARAEIFVCTDAQGHRITADRPIAACADREQKQFNPSGTVRRVLPPTLSPNELAEKEARERKLAEERQRLAEQKRVEKLLLARYPNQATHDFARANALRNVTGSERERIERHFDEELALLKTLWARQSATTAADDASVPVKR